MDKDEAEHLVRMRQLKACTWLWSRLSSDERGKVAAVAAICYPFGRWYTLNDLLGLWRDRPVSIVADLTNA